MITKKRNYTILTSRVGQLLNYPGAGITSDHRIRAVALEYFRRYFHTQVAGQWHKDGFMAEVWDNRGNRITVDQTNRTREPAHA